MGGSSELNTDNRHLCADHRFWSQVSCHNYGARWVPALGKSLKELRSTGMRCNGTIQVHFHTYMVKKDFDVIIPSKILGMHLSMVSEKLW